MEDLYHSHSPSKTDIILQSLRELRDADPMAYPMVPNDEPRTLILIGPSRGGKSTIPRVLEDSLYQPPEPNLYSATRVPEARQIGGLRVVDLPGFFDKQRISSDFSLSNEEVLKMVQEVGLNECISHYAFVFNLQEGIRDDDITAMVFLKDNLPQLQGNAMLVVTHSEELTDDHKDAKVNEFFSHSRVTQNNLRDFFYPIVNFLGCIRYESLKQENRRALKFEHTNVLRMRKLFIERCLMQGITYKHSDTIKRDMLVTATPRAQAINRQRDKNTYRRIFTIVCCIIWLSVFLFLIYLIYAAISCKRFQMNPCFNHTS